MYKVVKIGTKEVRVSSTYNRNGKEKFQVIFLDETYSKEIACKKAVSTTSAKRVVEEVNGFFGETVCELRSYGIFFNKYNKDYKVWAVDSLGNTHILFIDAVDDMEAQKKIYASGMKDIRQMISLT